MKLRCDRNELFERIQSISGVVSSAATTRPILQHCLLETEGDLLHVAVTDLTMSSRLSVERVEVEEPGRLALPASRLASLIREVPTSTLSIEGLEDGRGANLVAEGYRFRLLGEDPAEFPPLPTFNDTSALSVPRERFASTLRRVGVAASRDSSRFQLTGVFFEVVEDVLTMTATDGKRLTNDSLRIENSAGVAISAIVPNRAVDVMCKVLAQGEDKVLLSLSETEIQLGLEHGQVMAKLVEGSYPDYKAAIPSEVKTKVKARKLDLLAAAKSASLVTDKETATILFRFENDQVCLESKASDIGESRIEVPVDLQGEPLSIRFNPVFFIDALRTLPDEEIRMDFCGSDRPGTIRGAESYRHYLMPLVVG